MSLLKVDEIRNSAGSGSPNFPNGLKLNGENFNPLDYIPKYRYPLGFRPANNTTTPNTVLDIFDGETWDDTFVDIIRSGQGQSTLQPTD